MQIVAKSLPLKIMNGRLIWTTELSCGLSPEHKCTLVFDAGPAWLKQTPNGRKYYKMQFDILRTSMGQPLYGKAWSRKTDPSMFDDYTEVKNISDIKLHSRLARDVQLPLSGPAILVTSPH